MNIKRKIIFQVFAIIFFFSSLALVTHFVAKTILVRRRKTGKSANGAVRTTRGFSPSDFIPSDVLPFSMDQGPSNFDVEELISPETFKFDELMSVDLRIKRAIKRYEIALEELSVVSPETFPNPEISARILEGIFSFMRKKIQFAVWLEILRSYERGDGIETNFQEAFEYFSHTLPKEMEENMTIFENFDLAEKLTVLITAIKSTPSIKDLANNRAFHFLLIDFDMITAPPHMLRRPQSLKLFHQVTYYISMIGSVCSMLADGDTPVKFIMGSLESDSNRSLALLRFDFDIWGRMTAARRAIEISQRKDIDFELFDLLPESAKASRLIAKKVDL
jgi:hypothetical protein